MLRHIALKLQNMSFSKRRVLWNALILATLSGSIFLNFVLYNQAKKYYIELNQTRLDPVGLGYYPVDAQAMKAKSQSRVVFLGDSRAASWTSPSIRGYEFINRGIGSQTSIQVLQRFPQHLRSLKPDVVVIQVGINDLKTIALFPERRNEIAATSRANIKQLVEASRKLGAVVIVTTIFPVGEVPLMRRPFWSDEIGRAVQEINAYIATLANDKTFVFDTFSILADSQGMTVKSYEADELHLNEQGYARLNQELIQLLQTISQKN